jgi:peptidoglycan/LPS O-acetylase OafA/YrhL
MWWDRQRWWTVLVPPVTAGALMVLFFAVTDRWTNLENPVASQLAPLAGVFGFLAGMAAQRVRDWRLVAIPAGLTAAVWLWAYFAPNDTPEDEEFRQILGVLGFVLLLTTVAVNLPQISRGRHRVNPPSA